MKSNIWGTTGKKEANRRVEGVIPSGTPPTIPVPAPLTFMGSSLRHQDLRRKNNAAAERIRKENTNVLCVRQKN